MQIDFNAQQALVGTTGTIEIRVNKTDTIRVPVTLVNVRSVFGRVDVQVEPTLGSGKAWVQLDRVALDDPEAVKVQRGLV